MEILKLKRMAYLFVSIAALTSCTKQQFSDLYDPNHLQEQAKEAFPVKNIDPNQTWAMMSTRTVSVGVDGVAGTSYTLKVYSENPVFNSAAPLMAKTTATAGKTASFSFDSPTALERVFVSREGSDGRYVAVAELSGDKFVGSFETSAASSVASRSVIAGGKDPFPLGDNAIKVPTDAELNALFPTSVPDGVMAASKDVQIDLNNKNNLYFNSGTYNFNYWSAEAFVRELYIAPGQNVTFTGYMGTPMVVYLLSGARLNFGSFPSNANFTLVVCEGGIYEVSSDLTLNTGGDYIKIYNKGVIKASTLYMQKGTEIYNYGTLELPNGIVGNPGGNNFVTLYNGSTGSINSGKVTLGGGGSYFLNDGTFKGTDLEVDKVAFENNGDTEVGSVLLKGSGNLYNTGKMNVTGLTDATNSGCYWINNGHYSTGAMRYNSWNSTFYNYCQLLVRGKLEFSDCTFNLMDNGYVQCNSLDLGQGTIKMGTNAAFYVENGTYISKRQGDGQFQGFEGVGTSGLVKLGGETTIIGNHKHILSFKGNLTYTAEKMFPTEGNTNLNVDDAIGVLYTEANIPAPTQNECVPKWEIGTGGNDGGGSTEDQPYLFTYAFEDMTKEVGDYDFNDVVLQVSSPIDGAIKIKLLAAGATKNLRVGFNNKLTSDDNLLFDGREVHDVLGSSAGKITNTVSMNGTIYEMTMSVDAAFSVRIHGDFYILDDTNAKIHIPEFTEGGFTPGFVPYAIRVPKDWAYPRERVSIVDAYPDFVYWAQDATALNHWYDNPVMENVFSIVK